MANQESGLTHGSLFAGIGGFDLGFARAGIKTVWQVELDSYCRRVLERHFPDALRFEDIRDCGKHNLPWVDILSGGFPCQDISNAGKRSGIDGERSGLWSEYARIICELRPRYVVVENVAALLGRGMGRVLGDLAACGYDAEWQVISSCHFGLPHLRERLWIVAYPNSERVGEGHSKGRDEAKFAVPPGHHAATHWRKAYSRVCRMDDGIPRAIHRGRALGNAIVPQIAEWIGRRIVENG